MSRVTCHMSCVMCHMLHVTCHTSHFYFILFLFLDERVELVSGASVINGANPFQFLSYPDYLPRTPQIFTDPKCPKKLLQLGRIRGAPDSPNPLYRSHSEHLVTNGVHKQYFFLKYQFALNNHLIFLITKKINSYITKSLRIFLLEEFFLIFGPLKFFIRLKPCF